MCVCVGALARLNRCLINLGISGEAAIVAHFLFSAYVCVCTGDYALNFRNFNCFRGGMNFDWDVRSWREL